MAKDKVLIEIKTPAEITFHNLAGDERSEPDIEKVQMVVNLRDMGLGDPVSVNIIHLK